MLDFHLSRSLQVQDEPDFGDGSMPPIMSEAELDRLLSRSGNLSFVTENHKLALREIHRLIQSSAAEFVKTEFFFTRIKRQAMAYMSPTQYARFEAMCLNPLRLHAYARLHGMDEATIQRIVDDMAAVPMGVTQQKPVRDDGYDDTFMFGWLKKR